MITPVTTKTTEDVSNPAAAYCPSVEESITTATTIRIKHNIISAISIANSIISFPPSFYLGFE